MPLRIGILEPEGFSPAAREELAAIGEVEAFDRGEARAFVADKQALFVRLGHRIDDHLLGDANDLRYLCSPTTALDHIDEPALQARGIKLLSLRGERAFLETIRATPEHALGLIVAVLRRYGRAFQHAANAEQDRNSLRGREVNGLQVGIIGYGRVGQQVARYLREMGASVLFYDIDEAVAGVEDERTRSIEELIDRAELVLLAATHNEANMGLISSALLDRLAGKYFVNIARGELVDEDRLVELVEQRHFAGVALDVITGELDAVNNLARLVELSAEHNLVVTPHIAGATQESMHRTEEFLAAALRRKVDQAGSRPGR